MTLHIDLECYSDIDLQDCGVYAYSESPNFEILLFAYALDGDKTQIVDIAAGEAIPPHIFSLLTDDTVTKTAFNANFERTCLSRFYGIKLSPQKWVCSEVWASTMGLPRSLEKVAAVLNFPDHLQKDKKGKDLIKYFCIPCKPTKKNGGRTRNFYHHDLQKWEDFKSYCIRDVDVERAIGEILKPHPIINSEIKLWELDQRINDYGVRVDLQLATNALNIYDKFREKLIAKAISLTGLENPNSVAQLKEWLKEEDGELEVTGLTKETIPQLITATGNDKVKELLKLRQMMAKTSVQKYDAMLRSVNRDERVRGMFAFYGANRTGRWAGRIVQMHNLPKNKLKDLDLARELVRDGRLEDLEFYFGDVPYILSQLLRTAFIPAPNHHFIVSDFSAIEARIIAWLAGEKWRLDVFASHGKIYEASAAQMFRVPIETIVEGHPNYELRQKGKVAELALGYGGSVGALIKMGALNEGLTEEELPGLVTMWREASPKIVNYWWTVGNAAIEAVETGRDKILPHGVIISFTPSKQLMIRLPSKRQLVYHNTRLEIDPKYQRPTIVYDGVNQERKTWGPISTYGPKLVENITQAIARDCLSVAMTRLDRAQFYTVGTVHDEVILEVPDNQGDTIPTVNEIMGTPIDWGQGLLLTAKSFRTMYYKKD